MHKDGWTDGPSEFNVSSTKMLFSRTRSILLFTLDDIPVTLYRHILKI